MNTQPIINIKTVLLLSTFGVILFFFVPIDSTANQDFRTMGNYTIDIEPDQTTTIKSVRLPLKVEN